MINTTTGMLRWFESNVLNISIVVILILFSLFFLGILIVILKRIFGRIKRLKFHKKFQKNRPPHPTDSGESPHTKQQEDDDIVVMMKLGHSLFSQKKFQPAIDIYTDIISLCPDHVLALFNRGVIYYKLQNYSRAGNDFISAARLGHKKAQRILKSEGVDY